MSFWHSFVKFLFSAYNMPDVNAYAHKYPAYCCSILPLFFFFFFFFWAYATLAALSKVTEIAEILHEMLRRLIPLN